MEEVIEKAYRDIRAVQGYEYLSYDQIDEEVKKILEEVYRKGMNDAIHLIS